MKKSEIIKWFVDSLVEYGDEEISLIEFRKTQPVEGHTFLVEYEKKEEE